MEVGGTAELRTWILSFGSGAEVLEPQALRTDVVRNLEAALARYGAGVSRGHGRKPRRRPNRSRSSAASSN